MAILDADNRTVLHGKLKFEKVFRTKSMQGEEANLSVISVSTIMDRLKNVEGFGVERDTGKVIIRLQHVQTSECGNYVAVLLNVINKNGAATIVRDTQTNDKNELVLESPNQGYEASCHVVIDLNQDRVGTYSTVFEVVPKLGHARLVGVLNKALAKVSDLEEDLYRVDKDFQPVTGQTKKKDICLFKHHCTLTLDPDENFMQELRDGHVSNIKLIKFATDRLHLPDRQEAIYTKKHILEIEPSAERRNHLEIFQGIAQTDLGQEYDQISFSFKQDSGQRTATFDLQDIRVEGLEKTLVRKSFLENFNVPLKDSYDQVYDEIFEKIIEAETA
ncbi:hypothetical protein A152_0022395 [Vibrio tasmaniensis 1F-187]|nr:hypothetical protein [Vibrio tasmaniensis]OEF69465.1 hypothetical protein A152_02320 [Vibrio tasmaniensis 1F-187]